LSPPYKMRLWLLLLMCFGDQQRTTGTVTGARFDPL